jgi:hypothetical protein
MQAGVDFPSLFAQDNFTSRRTTGHNIYDPESLITGAEVAEGLSYDNSHREWMAEHMYLEACSGEMTSPKWIAIVAPMVEN